MVGMRKIEQRRGISRGSTTMTIRLDSSAGRELLGLAHHG
jgi:hypothetical protein